jgi:hypothetical protein
MRSRFVAITSALLVRLRFAVLGALLVHRASGAFLGLAGRHAAVLVRLLDVLVLSLALGGSLLGALGTLLSRSEASSQARYERPIRPGPTGYERLSGEPRRRRPGTRCSRNVEPPATTAQRSAALQTLRSFRSTTTTTANRAGLNSRHRRRRRLLERAHIPDIGRLRGGDHPAQDRPRQGEEAARRAVGNDLAWRENPVAALTYAVKDPVPRTLSGIGVAGRHGQGRAGKVGLAADDMPVSAPLRRSRGGRFSTPFTCFLTPPATAADALWSARGHPRLRGGSQRRPNGSAAQAFEPLTHGFADRPDLISVCRLGTTRHPALSRAHQTPTTNTAPRQRWRRRLAAREWRAPGLAGAITT